MKKTKVKENTRNPLEEIFYSEKLVKETVSSFGFNADALPDDLTSKNDKGNTKLTKILKRTLLFFPGSFILFYLSMVTVFLVTDVLTKNIYIPSNIKYQIALSYALGFLSIFAVWFGLGKKGDRRHLIIPASIISAGAFLGLLIQSLEGIFALAKNIKADFGYAVYLFPVALIIPILAKGLVDKNWKSDSLL